MWLKTKERDERSLLQRFQDEEGDETRVPTIDPFGKKLGVSQDGGVIIPRDVQHVD